MVVLFALAMYLPTLLTGFLTDDFLDAQTTFSESSRASNKSGVKTGIKALAAAIVPVVVYLFTRYLTFGNFSPLTDYAVPLVPVFSPSLAVLVQQYSSQRVLAVEIPGNGPVSGVQETYGV